MKKLICLLTAFVMMTAMLGQGMAFAVETEDLNISADSEAKVYSTATLEDDFADDRVMVVLKNDVSLDFKEYTAKDFPEIDCKEVRDFSKVARDRVKEKVEQLRVAAASSTLSALSLDMTDVDSYNQVLCIELENASKENVLAAIEKLQKRDDIIYAGPDYVVSITSTVPNDTKFVDQTASTRIQLPEAWDITTGSPSVVVGVIDSGIDATHSDLKNRVNVELSCDFTGATPVEGVTTDPLNHGTHVAGIIGAEGIILKA